MRRVAGVLLAAATVALLLEAGLRWSGVLQTYSERNFDRYDSYFDRVRATDWFLERGPVLIYDQAEFHIECPAGPMGLRSPGPAAGDSVHRVLFLGDSFTEGVGARCDSSLPARFQQATGNDTVAVNAGVVGSDPFLSLHWYEEHFKDLPHDEVVLVMNFSDLSDHVFWGGDERFDGDSVRSRPAPWFHGLYRHLHVVRAVVHGVLRYDFALTPPWRREAMLEEALDAYARRINEFTATHPDVPLTVVVHPYPFAVAQHVPGHDRLPSLGDRLPPTPRFIDLYPAFAEVLTAENHAQYSWPTDGHFNDAGYALFTRLLLREVRRSPGFGEIGGG